VDLYIHSPIRLHDVVLNSLSIETTSLFLGNLLRNLITELIIPFLKKIVPQN
jgi:hypothetical protein